MQEQSNTPLHNTSQDVGGGLAVPEKIIKSGDIIKLLHNKNTNSDKLAPSEVQSTLLCSNDTVNDCTSLGGKTKDEVETEIAKKLSAILFDKYVIWKQKQLKTLSSMEG